MFFGAVVRPGKAHPLVPHADGYTLHLSQASLAADVKTGTRASVLVRLGPKEAPVVLCTLCAGSQDTVLLDQFMAEYAELSIQGSVPVHLTGYYSPQYGGPDSDAEDEEEEDEEYGVPGRPINLAQYGLHGLAAGSSDEDESEEAGDEDEDDSMDDESDEDESSSGDEGPHREPSVIIEDITDQENAKAAKASLANGDAAKDGKKRKAAAAALPAPEIGGAAAKKQALAAQQKQQQEAPADKKQQQQTPKQQQQQQQKTPAGKQQQQAQQKTPADKQQQQQQKKKQTQEEKTPQSKPAAAAGSPAAQSAAGGKKSARVFDNGFEIHNVKMGDPHGKLAKGGKTVKVRYVGRLKSNGKVFDKTDKKPFAFRLGVGEVIKGWDRGVEGMRVGDKRKLVIPPQMGYGGQKTGPIPANSWLEFDVELLDVK